MVVMAIVCKSVQWGGGCGSTTNHGSFSCTQSASARHSSPRGWCDWVCTPNNRTPICQCHYAMHLLLLSTPALQRVFPVMHHGRDRQSAIDGSSCPIDRTSHLFSEAAADTALDSVWWGWMGGQSRQRRRITRSDSGAAAASVVQESEIGDEEIIISSWAFIVGTIVAEEMISCSWSCISKDVCKGTWC